MIKKIIIALVSLIILLIVAIGIFLATFDLNHYREFTEKKLSLLLNRPVQIGAMHTKLSFIPTIEISNFEILDSKENPKPILQIPQMDATVEIIPLIKNFQIEIQKIDILLISMDLSNLTLKTPQKDTPQANPKQQITEKTNSYSGLDKLWIKNININRVLCRFTNKEKKDAVELNNVILKDLSNLKFQLVYHNKKFDIDGSFGSLIKLISETKELPINLKIRQTGINVTLKGQIGNLKKMEKIRINATTNISKLSTFLKTWNIKIPTSLDGSVSSKIYLDGDLKKLRLTTFEINLNKGALLINTNGQLLNVNTQPSLEVSLNATLKESELAKQLNLNPAEFKTDLLLTSSNLNLNKILFRSGHSDLSGNLNLDWKNKLIVQPNLKSSYLDLKDIFKTENIFSNNSDTKINPKSKKQKSLKDDKIQWDILNKFNFDGKVSIDHLFVTNLITNYIGVDFNCQIKDGELNSTIKNKVLSGNINTNIYLNSNTKSAKFNLDGKDLNMDKIRAVYSHVRDAHINTQISLNTKGNTFKELINNMNGNLTIILLEGAFITDKWFNSLPIALTTAKQKTDFLDFSTANNKTKILCGVINLPIKNGILFINKSIAVQTEALSFILNGKINLNDEVLDLQIVPFIEKTNKMNNLLNLSQLIHVFGPWDNLSWKLDKKNAFNNLSNLELDIQQGDNFALCKNALGTDLDLKHPNRLHQPSVKTKTTPKKEEKQNIKDLLLKSLTPIISGNVSQ